MKLPANKALFVLEKISFELFGLTLLEPLSVLTNWLMAAQCWYYFIQIKPSRTGYDRFWGLFFLWYSCSFFFGGFSHLFFNYWGLYGKIPGWSCAVVGISLAEWGMLVRAERIHSVWKWIVVVKLAITLSLLIGDFKFLWVMLHTVGLLFFVGIPAFRRFKIGIRANRYFLFGIGCLIVTAPINILKIDIHKSWFTRDDLSHVFMIMAIWLFYRGVVATRD